MATSVNYYRVASHCYSCNTWDVGGSLCSCRADADGVGFASNTEVADIDIVIARGEEAPAANLTQYCVPVVLF